MTDIPIPSGPTNKEIINRAYQVMGLNDSMFGRTPEEYASAILPLGGMMLEWPFNGLGYDDEDAAGLRVEEESGIDRKYLETVAYCLAERIAPTIGKTLSPSAQAIKGRLYARLSAEQAAANLPTVGFKGGTPRGSGNRLFGGVTFSPFYSAGETATDSTAGS